MVIGANLGPRELKCICEGNYDPESKVTAALRLAGFGATDIDYSLKTLAGIVVKGTDLKCLHQSCASIVKLLDTQPDTDLYYLLNELINAFQMHKTPMEQKKIALALSSVLTHILIKYDSQRANNFRQIGKVSETEKTQMLETIRTIAKTKIEELSNPSLSYNADGYQITQLLTYIEYATYLLETEKSETSKIIEVFILLVSGVAQIVVNNSISDALSKFYTAYQKLDKSAPGWFGAVFAIKMLRITQAPTDPKAIMAIYNLISGTSPEILYQGLVSLGELAVHAKIGALNDMALDMLLNQGPRVVTVSLQMQFARSLAKISKESPNDAHRKRARNAFTPLLVTPFYSRYVVGSAEYNKWYDGKTPHSAKSAQKQLDFLTYSKKVQIDLRIPESSSSATEKPRNSNSLKALAKCLNITHANIERFLPDFETQFKTNDKAAISFNRESVNHLYQVLKKHPQIDNLDLRDSSISKESMTALLTALDKTGIILLRPSEPLKDAESETYAQAILANIKSKPGFVIKFSDCMSHLYLAKTINERHLAQAKLHIDRAMQLSEQSKEISYKNKLELYLYRCEIYRKSSLFKQAEEDAKFLAQATENNYKGKGYLELGVIAADRDGKITHAVEYFKKAYKYETTPEVAPIYIAHYVYKYRDKFTKSQIEEALQYAIKATELYPEIKSHKEMVNNLRKLCQAQ